MHYLPYDHRHPHEPEGPGAFDRRGAAQVRDYRERAFTIGIGGPVGQVPVAQAAVKTFRSRISNTGTAGPYRHQRDIILPFLLSYGASMRIIQVQIHVQ